MIHKIDETTQVECIYGAWTVWYQCPNGYWVDLPVAGAAEALKWAHHGRHYLVVLAPREND